jgi:hypothetical protein
VVLVEVNKFVQRYRGSVAPSVDLALRAHFYQTWNSPGSAR